MEQGLGGSRSPGPGVEVFVALGSNLGDRRRHLVSGLAGMPPALTALRVSSIVETPPSGYPEQGPFLNLVVRARTILEPHALLDHLRELEQAAGRVRSVADGPRTLDADLLFYGDRVIRTVRLTVPHPRWKERSFVVVPLLEVAPDLRDPVSGRPVAEVAAPEAFQGPLRRWADPPPVPSSEDVSAEAGSGGAC